MDLEFKIGHMSIENTKVSGKTTKEMEKEYEKWECDVGLIEPFVESILQVAIIFCLAYL